MNKLIIFTIVISLAIIELHKALQDGSVLRYLDEHPNPRVVPTIEYYIGGTYYVFHDLEEAATYYIRVPMRYPNSPLADDAYWEYLQTLDDSNDASRAFLVQEYSRYMDLFPKGDHLENVQNKIGEYRSGMR